MAGHEPVSRARETAVGEQRDRIAETRAHQSCGYREHLAHTGATLRTFVTDNDDISHFDAAFFHGGESSFFCIEHASGAAEILQIVAGDFYDRAFRREISF